MNKREYTVYPLPIGAIPVQMWTAHKHMDDDGWDYEIILPSGYHAIVQDKDLNRRKPGQALFFVGDPSTLTEGSFDDES